MGEVIRYGTFELAAAGTTVIGIENDGIIDGNCKLFGILGRIINDFVFHPLHQNGLNCTLVAYQNFGDYYEGTGLEGAFRNKEIDVALAPVIYGRFSNVSYTEPTHEETIALASAYRYNDTGFEDADLLDTYLGFHWSYYLSVILSMLLFILAWRFCSKTGKKIHKQIRRELRHARKPGYWLMICAILDQDQFPRVSRASFSAVSLCVSVGFYVIIDCFMLNMISTDLVVISEPPSIRSFSDILSKNVTVIFLKGMAEEQIYREAEEETDEYEMMKNVRLVEGTVPEVLIPLLTEALDQKYVGLIRHWVARVIANVFVPIVKDKTIRVYLATEEKGRKFLNAFMYHEDRVNSKFMEVTHKVMRQATEGGFMDWVLKEKLPQGIDFSGTVPEGSTWADQYASAHIDMPPMPKPRIRMVNMKKFIFLYSSLLSISLVVLIYEKLWSEIHKLL